MASASSMNMSPTRAETHLVVGAQSNDHSAHIAGVSAKRFFTDALTFARVQLLVTEYYRFDVVSNFWDVYNIEAEALGQKIIYPFRGIPDSDRTRPLIRTPSDLDRIIPPDPYTSGRMPWVREINRHYLKMTGKLERVYFSGPFSIAANIRGYENLDMDMFDRPNFVHRMFKFLCDDAIVPFVEVMKSEAENNNQIPADTPSDYIHAAVAACHTYGQFPISENLEDIPFEIPKRESFLEFSRQKGERFD